MSGLPGTLEEAKMAQALLATESVRALDCEERPRTEVHKDPSQEEFQNGLGRSPGSVKALGDVLPQVVNRRRLPA